jgi:putative proteasome-type protease
VTYCLAMRFGEGLVFLSDTRTNAGVDNVSTYRKLFVYHPAPDRTLVIQSAGNLGTTQEVLDRIESDLNSPDGHESLRTVGHLYEAALYLGRLNVQVADAHRNTVGAGVSCTFIIGGQIGDADADIYLVYPEGNYIRASDERPFLQIGETKYGKFLLELACQADLGIEVAAKVALSSMISAARANLSVGPPYDLGIYRTRSHSLDHARIEDGSTFLDELEGVWYRHLAQALRELPMVDPGDVNPLRPVTFSPFRSSHATA